MSTLQNEFTNIRENFSIFITATLKAEIKALRDKRLFPNGHGIIRTALDDLPTPTHRKHLDENDSDSSGNGTRFAKRTGVFEIDFPSDNKTEKNKGKGKTSAKKAPAVEGDLVTASSNTEENELDNSSNTDEGHTAASGDLFTSDASGHEISEAAKTKKSTKRLIKKGNLTCQ